MKQSKQFKLTRRELLRVAMLSSTGLLVAACAPPSSAVPAAPAAPVAAPTAASKPAAPAATTAPAAPAAAASAKEAPALAELVKQGKLPPLEKRLPEEPMVLTPIEEVGVYGGQMAWVIPDPQYGSYEYQFL